MIKKVTFNTLFKNLRTNSFWNRFNEGRLLILAGDGLELHNFLKFFLLKELRKRYSNFENSNSIVEIFSFFDDDRLIIYNQFKQLTMKDLNIIKLNLESNDKLKLIVHIMGESDYTFYDRFYSKTKESVLYADLSKYPRVKYSKLIASLLKYFNIPYDEGDSKEILRRKGNDLSLALLDIVRLNLYAPSSREETLNLCKSSVDLHAIQCGEAFLVGSPQFLTYIENVEIKKIISLLVLFFENILGEEKFQKYSRYTALREILPIAVSKEILLKLYKLDFNNYFQREKLYTLFLSVHKKHFSDIFEKD